MPKRIHPECSNEEYEESVRARMLKQYEPELRQMRRTMLEIQFDYRQATDDLFEWDEIDSLIMRLNELLPNKQEESHHGKEQRNDDRDPDPCGSAAGVPVAA